MRPRQRGVRFERRRRSTRGDPCVRRPRNTVLLPRGMHIDKRMRWRFRLTNQPMQKRDEMRPRQGGVGLERRRGGTCSDLVLRHPRHGRVLVFVGYVNKRMRRRRRLAFHVPDINRSLSARHRGVRQKTIPVDPGDVIVDRPLNGLGEILIVGYISVPGNTSRWRRRGQRPRSQTHHQPTPTNKRPNGART